MPQEKEIIIKAKLDGFRRCGTDFSRTGRQYPKAMFTADEWKILRADPMLIVSEAPGSGRDQVGAKPLDSAEEAQTRKILTATRVSKLKKELDRMGVSYSARATKSDLVDLLLKNSAPLPDEVA